MIFHQDFNKKLLALIAVGESLKGTRARKDDKILDAEALLLKFVYHCSTLDHLLKKTPSPLNNGGCFIDFASIIPIIRAAIENALSFTFIFALPQSKHELELRYLLWLYNGIQQLTKEKPILEQNAEVYYSLKRQLNSLEGQIKENKIFKSMQPKYAKNILKTGRSRFREVDDGKFENVAWADIAVEAGFDDTVAKQLYSFLSSYAHSDSLCISHIRLVKNESDKLQILDGPFDILEYIMGNMANRYVSIIRGLNESSQGLSTL